MLMVVVAVVVCSSYGAKVVQRVEVEGMHFCSCKSDMQSRPTCLRVELLSILTTTKGAQHGRTKSRMTT